MKESKCAEEVLTESEEKYRLLVENANEAIVVAQDGRLKFANPNTTDLMGYSKKELTSKPFLEFIHPDDRAIVSKNHLKRLQGEILPGIYPFRIVQKNGNTKWVEINAVLINWEGKPATLNFLTDITERKRAEEALQISEYQYRTTLNSMGDAIHVVNKDLRLVLINKAFRQWIKELGLEDEILGKTIFEAFPFLSQEVRKEYQKVFDTGQILITEELNKVGDQKIFTETRKIPIFEGEKVSRVVTLIQNVTEQKKAIEALRESQETLKMVFDSVDADIYIGDLKTYEILYMNKHMKDSFGHNLIGKICYQVFRNESAPCIHCTNNKLLDLNGNPTGVCVWEAHNSTTGRWYVNYDRAIRWLDGRLVRLQIATDITEIKQTEEALRESQQLLKKTFASLREAVFIIDAETVKIIDCNPSASEIFGYDREEMLGRTTLFLHVDEAALEEFRKHLYANVEQKGYLNLAEFRMKRKNGEIFFTEHSVTPFEGDHGKRMGWVSVIRDITERKRIEKALLESEEAARRLAKENVIIAEIGRIISSSLNIDEVYERFTNEVGKLISFDRIVINTVDIHKGTTTTPYAAGIDVPNRQIGISIPLSGTATEECFRKRSSLLIQPENIDECLARFPALLPTFQAGLRSIILTPLISKDQFIGALSLRSLTPKAYTDLDVRLTESIANQIAGAIANAQLFTEHQRAEDEKARLEEQLRQSQKMEAVGRLAGGIAHDFNNLLTVIKGYSQLSLLKLKEGDPLKGSIEEIQRAADRAATLTQQLLAFSRRQILEFKVIDLNTILRDLEKMLRRIIGEDIELVYLLSDDLGKIKTDPGQIEQVILNLAVNARDAMPSGGKLTIETANIELDEKYARTSIGIKPGHYAAISVSDTGVGMTPEVKEHLFEPFFTTKEKGKGTGLGLSTIYGIVKQSEGGVSVYSEPGQGTTLKIYLPRVEEETSPLLHKDDKDSLPRGSETILLVEDEPSVKGFAVQVLRENGYKLLEAGNGNEALRMAKEHAGEIHLLFTDVVMPLMGGKELASNLKTFLPDIKVLFTSGYTDNAIVHHGALDPGTNFLQKPFTPAALAQKVREVLDKGKRP